MYGLGFLAALWLVLIVVFLAVPILIGVLVFRDARRQGMSSPLAWALAAALAPSFIGLIIYLVVRSSGGRSE